MKNSPLVSIVMCAHNRETMIGQTIEAILNQNFVKPYELLIGEDCSTDNTLKICQDYQNRYPNIINVVQHKENCGLGKNWAILVQNARGKYVASCDDDDYWHNPNKLSLQVEFLEQNPEYGMVHTECDILNVRKNKIYPNYYHSNNIKINTGNTTQDIFSDKSPICVSTSMFRKELVDKHVLLDKYIEHRFNIQDWPTWMILSKYSKIGYIDVSTTTYRVGHFAISNYGSLEKTEKKVETDQKMYKIICEQLPEDVKYDENIYIRYKLKILLKAAYKELDFRKAKEYIRKYNGSLISDHKVKMAGNIITFYMYAYLIHLKRIFIKYKQY